MHGNQQVAPQIHNGICLNIPDTSTFLNNPQENQAIPHPQMTQWFQQQQSQQMYADGVGRLRALLQQRSNRTYLHTWTYNYLSQNQFNNQAWQQWCGLLVNFMEFLSVAQPQTNPPAQAVSRAVDTVYKCILSATCDTAGLHQLIAHDQTAMAEQVKYRDQLQVINQDIQSYRQGTYRMPTQQQQQQYRTMPAPTYGAPQPQQYGVSSVVQQAALPNYNVGGGSTPAPNNYSLVQAAEPQAPKSLQPVESYGAPILTEVAAPNVLTQIYATKPDLDTQLPVPLNAAKVVMDPNYYVPNGVTIDPTRPFDVIHSPGGIITRPAFLEPDWTVSRSDSYIHTEMLDPAKYIRFYTKFPDGLVEEQIMEYTPDMNYLNHEINIDLKERVANAHNKGKPPVVYAKTKVGTVLTDMVTVAEVVDLPTIDSATPIKMANEFQGSTEMEIERMAAIELRRSLKVSKEDTLPAHEYFSSTGHAIDVTREVYDQLVELAETGDLLTVAKVVTRLTESGELSMRVSNHINQRFTTDVNAYLADALSMDLRIDDFCADIGDVFNYFNSTPMYGKAYSDMLQKAGHHLVGFILNLDVDVVEGDEESEEDEVFSMISRYTNLQTGWTLKQLTDRPTIGEVNLVSRHTHQALIQAVQGMNQRASEKERLTHRFRVITIDGAYLEMFRGALVTGAFLFKRTI